MPEYLSKEEVRQWRSSLERITLEEYAQRLGKVISDEKETNDIVDIVMKKSSFAQETPLTSYHVKVEKISSLAQQSFEREQEFDDVRISREVIKPKKTVQKVVEKTVEKTVVAKTKAVPTEKKEAAVKLPRISSEDIQLTFKKNLTPREQAVFEHFLNNKNHIVYAKELAQVLELPRDYVYKYIKNLRSKLNEDALHNADNGGFILNA